MKNIIFKQIPLYRFLQLCNEENNQNSKKISDCGAGGNNPPLSLFYSLGYEITGFDLDLNQVEKANTFGLSNNKN